MRIELEKLKNINIIINKKEELVNKNNINLNENLNKDKFIKKIVYREEKREIKNPKMFSNEEDEEEEDEGKKPAIPRRPPPPLSPAAAGATRSETSPLAAGTASSRLIRATIAQVSTIASPSTGVPATARTGARHSGSSTPASIALAIGFGIAATARPSGLNCPARMSSTAQIMKAPTAPANPPGATLDPASSAAPGVDQAIEIGSLVRRSGLRGVGTSLMPRPRREWRRRRTIRVRN